METYQKNRFILIFALVFVGMMLYQHWQEKNNPTTTQTQTANSNSPGLNAPQQKAHSDLPTAPSTFTSEATATHTTDNQTNSTIPAHRLISLTTPKYEIQIDKKGGDLVGLNLRDYPISLKAKDKGHRLLRQDLNQLYIVQTGLLSPQGPDSETLGRVEYNQLDANAYHKKTQASALVRLHKRLDSGVEIEKQFVFNPDNHIIEVRFAIKNASKTTYHARLYGRIKRQEAKSESGLGMRAFSGAAMNKPDKKYQKKTFKDLKKSPEKFYNTGGWIAMVDHYFLTALIPNQAQKNYFQTEQLPEALYGAGFFGPEISVAPGNSEKLSFKIYAGPENTEVLSALAPGLELTADYGILWPICQPIFWGLKKIQGGVGNWGVAIILVTVFIKALFFHLSAASYRSMGRMRQLQPRVEALKQRFGDDKQKFGQAVMNLYKEEKVNPLGGCLPILVQIPVFIALYYVLLGSVELRQAPFALWLVDLSAKDPFYVLPILMGASMWFQQKLNPAPPDPVQAKVMMAMPLVFTVVFLQFPSGLVLYWLVNNILSIAQQWIITRKIEKSAHKPKR